jgi:ABC-2 type transport system permease protein
LGIAALVSLVTTIPAVVLYVQYGMMTLEETYFQDTYQTILFGILIYGSLVSVTLSLLCVGLGSWLHRTVPLVMSWGMLFILMPVVSAALHRIFASNFRDRSEKSSWLLLNFWRDLRIIGEYFFDDLKDADAPYLPAMVLIVLTVSLLSALAAWWKLRVIRVVS